MEIQPPLLSVGSIGDLGLDSTLKELQLYSFAVDISCTGSELAVFFEKYPLLPGAILVEQGNYVGMISRKQLLEFLIRPYGSELFFQAPLNVIYSYARTNILVLPETTSILAAMQIALRRSKELLAEPVVVKTASDTYSILDVQELNIASWQIRGIEAQVRYERSQAQMIQNDKMASLGRLVNGVAHEILDPVGFIWGNLSYVSSYSQGLLKLIAEYSREFPSDPKSIVNIKEEIEFEFLEQDLTKALSSIRTGASRLKKLVSGLQNFCYIDEVYPKPADIHACIDGILLLMNSRLKGEFIIVKNYGNLPPINCFIGQLNQVFMNILSQAVDTLLDAAVRQRYHENEHQNTVKPCIEITTKVTSLDASKQADPNDRWISICIADNGQGMSAELQKQIIDSFSVATRTDKETNLAVSYRIVTARHGGKFILRSQLGVGTEFEILLPLA